MSKDRICAWLSLALVTLLIEPSLVIGEIRQINLIRNPGFEQGECFPECWSTGKNAENPIVVRDTGVFRSGKASLRWESNSPDGAYRLIGQKHRLMKGRKYELSAWVKTENLIPDTNKHRESGATICLGYSDSHGKYVSGGPHPGGQKDTRGWWKLVAYTGPIPDNVTHGTFTCYVRRNALTKRIFTGKAWWDDVCLRPVSFSATMLRPTSKRMLTSESSLVEFELECWPGDYNLSFDETLVEFQVKDKDGHLVLTREFDTEKRMVRVSFDLKSLEAGDYRVVSIFKVRRTGQELWRWEHGVTRAPKSFKPKVRIDKHGRLIRNGKPMFPLGVYVRKAPIEELKDSGFNCFMSYDILNKGHMDKAHEAGLAVIYSIKDYYNKIWYCGGGIRHVDDEIPALLRVVKKHRNHPALLAWYVNDELGPECLPQHRAHYEALSKADPDHPAWLLHCKPAEVSMLTDSFDIIGMDKYPVPNGDLRVVADSARETLKQVRGTRPLWYVPQIFNKSNYGSKNGRAPTLPEMRNMSWQAICEGTQGLIYYSFFDLQRDKRNSFDERWSQVKQMVAEINEYTDVLLSVEDCPEVKVKASKRLRWTSRKLGDKVYVFVVSDGSVSGKVYVKVDADVKSVKAITVGSEGIQDMEVRGKNSWNDSFEIMQAKVYTIHLAKTFHDVGPVNTD